MTTTTFAAVAPGDVLHAHTFGDTQEVVAVATMPDGRVRLTVADWQTGQRRDLFRDADEPAYLVDLSDANFLPEPMGVRR